MAKHMANKQMERHMNKAFAGKESPTEEKYEDRMMHGEGGGGEADQQHESFHVFKHAGGAHSVHHHGGGVDHADHASHEEAMDHGKMAMGGGVHEEPDGDEAQMAPAGEEENWG